jgi:sugar phosphate isomerase/epimerase
VGFKYAVFTVMIPEYKVEEVPRILSMYGYDGVEWRVAPIPQIQPVKPSYWQGNLATIDESKLLEEASRVKKLTEEYGLSIPALGTYFRVPGEDLARVRRGFEAARIIDAKQLRVSAPRYDGSIKYRVLLEKAVEEYRTIERMAKEYGIKCCVEIHMGTICPSPSSTYRFISNFDPKYVGVILDPGNMVHEGYENWLMGLEVLGEYLAHVHVKNAVWKLVREEDGAKIWAPTHAPVMEGYVYWLDVMKALIKVGYDGWLSFEDFSDIPTEEKLRKNIEYMKKLEAKARS